MEKLRIAVWHNLPSGGGKRQLYNHVQGLIERGHYVESWCPDSADQKHLPLGRLIKEHIIPLKRKRDSYHDPSRPLSITRELLDAMEEQCRTCADAINSGGFDVLYANACMYLRSTPIAKYVNLPSAMYLGEPFRWFYEAMPELPWIAPVNFGERKLSLRSLLDYFKHRSSLSTMRVQARAELEYIKGFDSILVNSVYSRETVLRTYNLESDVCYLGIDSDYYTPTGEAKENFVVGLGTLYHGKGVDRAIRAVGAVDSSKRPDLLWIGNGAALHEFQGYELLARDLGVNFIPKVHISDEEVISLLSRATAMVYTSRLEPFGLAPLEANACCTPVVGIAEGGVKETIRDGVNGFLTKGDDPHALGKLISDFIDDPQQVVQMGTQAREHVKKVWSMKMCTDNIESRLGHLSKAKRIKKILGDSALLHQIEPTDDIRMNLDEFSIKANRVRIKGWAFTDDGHGARGSAIFLVVRDDASTRLIPTNSCRRPDVTDYFGNIANYEDSGFTLERTIENLESARIGVLITRENAFSMQFV